MSTHQMHKWVRFSGAQRKPCVQKPETNSRQKLAEYVERKDKLWIKCVDIKEKERQMPFLEITYRISIPGKKKKPKKNQLDPDQSRL